MDFSLSPIFNENGNVIFLLAEGRDMTEQIKAKNDLIMEKEFSENLIKSLPGLFFLYKLENNSFALKKWNSQHEELLGLCLLYTSDAADDTPCVDLGGRRIIKKKKLDVIL
eukprot:TRINITY_DN62079_c0_g1_i1.p2 TRINITY_DN62079_c0_g1~~TRINITY_DN62079_c0_g1_i1.p2  ORF type:complete len:111 (+),score=31.20 TRINITY_DN62079_c0_g1_i1:239-571(+)